MKSSLWYKNLTECLPLCLLTFSLPPLIYEFLNNWDGPVNTLVIDLDRMVPFLKIFVVPYLLWYPFFILAVLILALQDKKIFYQTLISINITEGICFLIYFIYQTTVPRPVLEGHDTLTNLIRMVYSHDQPFNCFPSIHVLTTYLFLRGINKLRIIFTVKGILNIIGVLIICSTVFIKQHVVLDVFSAIILSEAVIWTVVFLQQKQPVLGQKYLYPLFNDDKKARKYI